MALNYNKHEKAFKLASNAPAAAIEKSSADERVQRCQIPAGIVNCNVASYSSGGTIKLPAKNGNLC